MKRLLFAALLVSAVFVSCSKEQRVVNKLEGTWKATSAKAEYGGLSLDIPIDDTINIQYTFYDCKLKDGDCEGLYVNSLDGSSDNFTYTIGDGGNTINSKDENGNPFSVELLELEKETFKIKDDMGLDSTSTLSFTVTFKRQS